MRPALRPDEEPGKGNDCREGQCRETAAQPAFGAAVARPFVHTAKLAGNALPGIGPHIGLRLYPDIEEALDAWIAQQPDPKPSKPEAIRRILRGSLHLNRADLDR